MLKHTGKGTPAELIRAGAIVEVTLQPAPEVVKAMRTANVTPPSVDVQLMVDTGASMTVIEDSVIQELSINPIRTVPIVGVSQKAEDCPLYRMSIRIGMANNRGLAQVAEFGANIAGVPSPKRESAHVGLLGRDFLHYVRFLYDGPQGEYQIIDYRADPPASSRSTSRSKSAKTRQKDKAKRKTARKSRKGK